MYARDWISDFEFGERASPLLMTFIKTQVSEVAKQKRFRSELKRLELFPVGVDQIIIAYCDDYDEVIKKCYQYMLHRSVLHRRLRSMLVWSLPYDWKTKMDYIRLENKLERTHDRFINFIINLQDPNDHTVPDLSGLDYY